MWVCTLKLSQYQSGSFPFWTSAHRTIANRTLAPRTFANLRWFALYAHIYIQEWKVGWMKWHSLFATDIRAIVWMRRPPSVGPVFLTALAAAARRGRLRGECQPTLRWLVTLKRQLDYGEEALRCGHRRVVSRRRGTLTSFCFTRGRVDIRNLPLSAGLAAKKNHGRWVICHGRHALWAPRALAKKVSPGLVTTGSATKRIPQKSIILLTLITCIFLPTYNKPINNNNIFICTIKAQSI